MDSFELLFMKIESKYSNFKQENESENVVWN